MHIHLQLQLRDKNERLHQKLEQLQGRFGDIATTKTDLSAQLLMTEEEKLKVRFYTKICTNIFRSYWFQQYSIVESDGCE